MRDLFIAWIIIQLMVIGAVSVSIENDIVKRTFDCDEVGEVPVWIGLAFPLGSFVPDNQEVITYCEELKRNDLSPQKGGEKHE